MKNYRPTSRQAWLSILPVSAELDRQIMGAIASHSRIICADIETVIGRNHQAVSGNLRHLVERGLVEDSGETGLTPSRRPAIKWQLTYYARTGVSRPVQQQPEQQGQLL